MQYYTEFPSIASLSPIFHACTFGNLSDAEPQHGGLLRSARGSIRGNVARDVARGCNNEFISIIECGKVTAEFGQAFNIYVSAHN